MPRFSRDKLYSIPAEVCEELAAFAQSLVQATLSEDKHFPEISIPP
jgi:hypothetical protein